MSAQDADAFAALLRAAEDADLQHPGRLSSMHRLARLAAATGAVAEVVAHAEPAVRGGRASEHDRGQLAAQAVFLLRDTLGLVRHYGALGELRAAIGDIDPAGRQD